MSNRKKRDALNALVRQCAEAGVTPGEVAVWWYLQLDAQGLRELKAEGVERHTTLAQYVEENFDAFNDEAYDYIIQDRDDFINLLDECGTPRHVGCPPRSPV